MPKRYTDSLFPTSVGQWIQALALGAAFWLAVIAALLLGGRSL